MPVALFAIVNHSVYVARNFEYLQFGTIVKLAQWYVNCIHPTCKINFWPILMKKQPNNHPKSNKKASTSSMRLALESRLLFDGAVVATAAQVVDDKAAQDQAQDTNKDVSVDAAPDAIMDAAHSPPCLWRLNGHQKR
jgi:hypothetical protein